VASNLSTNENDLFMPTLYQLKPGFQSMLRPIVARLAAAGVTANQVTVAAALSSVGLGAYLTNQQRGWILLPPFLVLRMALNAIDGMLAREHHHHSPLGAILNELADIISDAALTFPLAVVPGWDPLWICAVVFCSALVEVAGILALMIGSARRYDGPFGKSDRALALGVIAVLLALGWQASALASAALSCLWIILCAVTVVNRAHRALRSSALR
jgi:CDP-diacylglycerol--glycerol-3-phosphate 3-phosphatidyltransferase